MKLAKLNQTVEKRLNKSRFTIDKSDYDEKKWPNLSADELLSVLESHTDEALWDKAKKASQEAFGEIRYPFVMWLYQKWGGT